MELYSMVVISIVFLSPPAPLTAEYRQHGINGKKMYKKLVCRRAETLKKQRSLAFFYLLIRKARPQQISEAFAHGRAQYQTSTQP
jgi:hypothetical protein